MYYLLDSHRCCEIILHAWAGWRQRNPPGCRVCSVLLCYVEQNRTVCGSTCMSCFSLAWRISEHFWLECCCFCIVLPPFLQPFATSLWNSSAFVRRCSKCFWSVCPVPSSFSSAHFRLTVLGICSCKCGWKHHGCQPYIVWPWPGTSGRDG